jgi:tetratricopeptide (TPR) repeat protein
LDAGLTKRHDLYFVREFLPSSELFSADASLWIPYLVSAIDFLHRHGRIHGAIRPSNIFSANENFKLSDARPGGLKLVEGEESIHFTAPEILRGAPVSQEGDLYSIGAVLYRSLTGRHLFEDSDLNRLKSKYLSAAPQPTQLPLVSSIAQLTVELLNKNPAGRRESFDRLKRVVSIKTFVPHRCALIGREREVLQVIDLVQKRSSLRVVSLEGEVGIGKTRLIDEMQLHCAFRGYTFAIWQCKQNSGALAPVTEGLNRLIRTDAPRAHRFPLERLERQPSPACSDAVEHPPEKTTSEMISALASFAVNHPTVIAVDDVNLADPGTVMFLEQLAFRAVDLPLTLLVASRPAEVEPKWVTTVVRCLGRDFHFFRLPSLSEEQSQTLAKFFETDSEKKDKVLTLAAGNPLFISAFASSKQPLDLEPSSVTEAAATLLSCLSKDTRCLLDVLSVIQRPLCVNLLQSLCRTTTTKLERWLATAIRVGIVRCDGSTVEIKLPIIRDRVFKSLPKRRKVSVARMAFTLLRDVERDLDVLAEYAFQAGLFDDAAQLYADLADREYKSEEYSRALVHYERLRKCRKYLRDSLTATEALNAARCYDRTGRQSSSSRLYKELLRTESVQRDPSLLSLIYIRLASATNQSAYKDRLRYLELAIDCLPKNSSHIRRYTCVCDLLAASGALSRAKKLFTKMEEYVITDNADPTVLDESRARLLAYTCDFRGSIECYCRGLQHEPNNVPLLVNTGLCFECLGELETALNYYLQRAAKRGRGW